MKDKAGSNIDKPPLRVEHAKLERTDESLFRSKCPACGDGFLLVMRDQQTLQLLPIDCCILCGQQVVYTDMKNGKLGDLK